MYPYSSWTLCLLYPITDYKVTVDVSQLYLCLLYVGMSLCVYASDPDDQEDLH